LNDASAVPVVPGTSPLLSVDTDTVNPLRGRRIRLEGRDDDSVSGDNFWSPCRFRDFFFDFFDFVTSFSFSDTAVGSSFESIFKEPAIVQFKDDKLSF
jgi:hypothetical protein